MLNLTCNIDKTERINRVVIGAIMLLAAILGAGVWFFTLVSLVLIVEGAIGWCGIPVIVEKIKGLLKKT